MEHPAPDEGTPLFLLAVVDFTELDARPEGACKRSAKGEAVTSPSEGIWRRELDCVTRKRLGVREWIGGC